MSAITMPVVIKDTTSPCGLMALIQAVADATLIACAANVS
jgi:hypothetical protein